jgi:flagella basal body P-ring formation protein FlgA
MFLRMMLLAALVLTPAVAVADTLVAARMLRAETVIAPSDLVLRNEVTPGALSDPADAIGMEVRRNVYAGQVLRETDLGPPALVERNDLVVLSYFRGGLAIVTEGRSLGRAGVGERLQVMNLASRTSVIGTVLPDGTVEVVGPH